MAKGDKNINTGNRETMGTSVAETVNFAKPQRGKSIRKSGNAKGGMLEGATAAHRATVHERLGFKGAPQAALYAPNAAEANLTQRNVRTIPSATGNADFYLRRQYGQGT